MAMNLLSCLPPACRTSGSSQTWKTFSAPTPPCLILARGVQVGIPEGQPPPSGSPCCRPTRVRSRLPSVVPLCVPLPHFLSCVTWHADSWLCPWFSVGRLVAYLKIHNEVDGLTLHSGELDQYHCMLGKTCWLRSSSRGQNTRQPGGTATCKKLHPPQRRRFEHPWQSSHQ